MENLRQGVCVWGGGCQEPLQRDRLSLFPFQALSEPNTRSWYRQLHVVGVP